ncbi:hypothetical protein JOD97_000661 [Duganella sp. 1411]|jgi:hypothetical protein|uniref:hypothetical protein n=1 Tax=Duganella sp. 1411 TaxID=2806572 RepID=UPI001AE23B1A|nr:hypothetical protein [Duganella sp. 1411]MBP1202647.1 hypothetical protein [Duganella sp. 1411]
MEKPISLPVQPVVHTIRYTPSGPLVDRGITQYVTTGRFDDALTNHLCLAFLAGILVVMYLTPDPRQRRDPH